MAKVVIPKHCASKFEVLSTLKVYYENRGWLDNDFVTKRLKEIIGADQYHSSYTKKCQVLCYFGFVVWQDILNRRSVKKITDSGCRFYESLLSNNQEEIDRLIIESLQTIDFGRNNCGAPTSDSSIQPPILAIRLILDFGFVTYREFAYAIWTLEQRVDSYPEILLHLKAVRNGGALQLPAAAKIYADAKPLMMLERWGFLVKHLEGVSLSRVVRDTYGSILNELAFLK